MMSRLFPPGLTGCMRYCAGCCAVMGSYRKMHSRLKNRLLFAIYFHQTFLLYQLLSITSIYERKVLLRNSVSRVLFLYKMAVLWICLKDLSEKVKLLADTIRATSVQRTFTTEQFEASTRHNGGIYLCVNNANLGLCPNCFIMWCASATSELFPCKERVCGWFQPLVMLITQQWSVPVQL